MNCPEFGGRIVLVEIHDEWAVASERRYLSEARMKLIPPPQSDPEEVAKPTALKT